jgi:HD-GYP domain-containing protein (c-di-GMP phosphodiesterase class II)
MPEERASRFLVAFHLALQSLKSYAIENAQVRKALEGLSKSANAIFESENQLVARVAGELLYVNSAPVRLDVDNFASLGHVLRTLQLAGVGIIRVLEPADTQEWKVLIAQILKHSAKEDVAEGISDMRRRLRDLGVDRIIVEPPVDKDVAFADAIQRRESAKRTYQRSVSVTKDLFSSARMGRSGQVKEIKHALQNIVDQVLKNEVSLVGLTTLRDYDDYTFIHSVNVCIFSVALGRRLGLTRPQLFDLGLAAMLHDVGMSWVPVEVLDKQDPLTDEEQRQMEAHTWRGALSIFNLRDYGGIPFRAMIAAYEHHIKANLGGYPKSIRPRKLSVFSKIIAVADAYNAALSTRAHASGKSPDVALGEMWDDPDAGYDPVLVKALINLLGIYPVGTCVILDTFELALVHAANPDSTQLHRPLVRIISNPDGTWMETPPLVDLADKNDEGDYERTIIKVTDPEKYMVNVADYFV